MKSLHSLAFILLSVSAPLAIAAPPAAPPAEVAQFLAEGQAAFNKGDYASAKAAFEMVYSLDTRNVTAISYLQKIKVLEKNVPKSVDQQKQLAGLIVPKVEFKEATIGSVFDYLRRQAAKLSNDQIAVNFVLQLPDEQIKTQTITLNLSNVPFTEVVRYVADVASLTVEYQKYAVVVKPKAAAAPATADAGGPVK